MTRWRCAAMPTEQTPPDPRLLRVLEMVRDTGYRFITPTPATHARVLRRPGHAVARDLRDVFGWSHPFAADIVGGPLLVAMRDAALLLEAPEGFRSTIRLSTLAETLFAHSAYPTSAADTVFFGPDTYRFARAIHYEEAGAVRRAVDICCGAGPGAVVIAKRWPGAEVVGVDINPEALRLARANAALAGVRADFVISNLLSGLDGQFDLIVANPPYLVDAGERTYRHGGGPLGAGLSLKILDAAIERLEPGGKLLLYTGAAIVSGVDPFRDAALARLTGKKVFWTYEEIDPDVFGEEVEQGVYAVADRIAAVLLTVQRND